MRSFSSADNPFMSDHTPSSGTVAVIILTYNEEANIAQALSNVVGWADEVFVLDSMSTDGTLAIAKQYRMPCRAASLRGLRQAAQLRPGHPADSL